METAPLLLFCDPLLESLLSGERSRSLCLSLVDLAEEHGLSGNLYAHMLAYCLLRQENAYSLHCEHGAVPTGTLFALAKRDMATLFAFLRENRPDDGFSTWQTDRRPTRVGERIQALSERLQAAADPLDMLNALSKEYCRYGAGDLGLYQGFRAFSDGVVLSPIRLPDPVRLDDLIGIDLQKQQMCENIEAFVQRRTSNDMLLYGDAGTGKSTSVRALLNEYAPMGLRIVELTRDSYLRFPELMAVLGRRGQRFLIFLDDLSFEENEVEYKALKSVIEGGLVPRPENVRICATSNRRHLIREVWSDRNDMEHDGDVHRSDTLEEKLSLAARFGCAVRFLSPNQKQYHEIVKGIARRRGDLDMDDADLLAAASRWEIRHGGRSGRTAMQFVSSLNNPQEDANDHA